MNNAFFDFGKNYISLLWLLILFCSFSKKIYAQPAGFSDKLVIDGWSQAVGLTFDKNGRMYVWEKGGKVWIVEKGVRYADPLIDISEEVGNWRDFGLVGFALDPNFLNNGYIYLWYVVDRHHLLHFNTSNYDPNTSNEKAATIGRLTRYTTEAPNNFATVDYGSRKVLIGETKSTGPPILHESHGVGQIVFGTDGTLIASIGDGASYTSPIDQGSHPTTYFQQAIDDGIITSAQNIGAYRCQTLDNLSGKILRIDPKTGNGLPSNPFYQPDNPRSPQSRIWSLGVRNPYRITLKPETGSHNSNDGDPGTFFFGDVGWSTWEDLNVIDVPGLNFGWPIYEGIAYQPGYDQPEYALSIDEHECPKMSWKHGADQSKAVINGSVYTVGNGPVSGHPFRGNASTGGVWYTGDGFPSEYKNTYFHADYSTGWIRNFGFDEKNNPIFVKDFKLNAGAVVFLNTSPVEDGLFYVRYPNQIRKITFTGNANVKPIAIIQADKSYGPDLLEVQFDASQSFDPEYSRLSYNWDFGDGATSTSIAPKHIFQTNTDAPITFPVTLTVTDKQGESDKKTTLISLNNTPPAIISTSLDEVHTFNSTSNTTLNLSATVVDAEHNGQLSYEWQTFLYHNGHSHAEPVDNNPSTTTSLSPVGCDGTTYWFRITLKVTDPEGLSAHFQKDIFPDCSGYSQAINFAPVSDKFITAGSFLVDVSATSGLPVSIFLLEGPAYIFNNKVVLTGFPGKVILRATQGGNDKYAPANPVEQSFKIIIPPNSSCNATGNISRDVWINVEGAKINDIPINAPVDQTSILNRFEAPANMLDNYAQRIRGFLCPPQTGLYTFWVSSNDNGQLWLSTNNDPDNKRLIADVRGWTFQNQWNKYSSQQSEPILLAEGSQYYIEAIMKEGVGGDHLSVGWQLPDNTLDRPISGQYLFPWTGDVKQNQNISFFGIPDKITTDPPFAVRATASSGLPVTFSIVSGPATISGEVVSLTGNQGMVVVRAKQEGNDQYNAALEVERSFEVNPPPSLPEIRINAPVNESVISGAMVDIQYSLLGNLDFYNATHLLITLDDQIPIDAHTLSGNYRLEEISEGQHTLILQLANSNHQPFTHSGAIDIINFSTEIPLLEQSINFPVIPDKLTTDPYFAINAIASSGLPVSFKVLSGPAMVNGDIVSLEGAVGTVVIQAYQNGNEAYKSAPSVNQSFAVSQPNSVEENAQNYCTTNSDFPWQEWIEQVHFGSIDHTSFKDGYGDFINQSTLVEKGKTYPISIIPAYSWTQWDEYIKVWIDFNGDGNFEGTEEVLAAVNQGQPAQSSVQGVSGEILIPTTAVEGATRMRISMRRAAYSTPCGTLDFGEVEDYTVIIRAADTNQKLDQSIIFPTISDKLSTEGPFAINATATSNLTVSFAIASGPATVNHNIISLTGLAGRVVVKRKSRRKRPV